jgi:quercetin dioxygenase-like cupin family protein
MKVLLQSLAVMLCCWSVSLAQPTTSTTRSTVPPTIFANLKGEPLLENERVYVERFLVKPGQATGTHSHRNPQVLVFIRGGVLTGHNGRATLWKDGRVQWFAGNSTVEDGSTNAGSSDIEIVCVALKPRSVGSPEPAHRVEPLSYPNIPGEDLLENDWVIVQRFVVQPGQWEGVHAHQPNMLYVHIKGGQWAARSKLEAQHAYPDPSPDGSVGWMDPIDISAGHESGNIGSNPIDFIWISLKN